MTDSQITQEILRYIEDSSYDYAVLIDGEWGCGKTYYIKNSLIKDIVSHEGEKENGRKVKYISLYGCKVFKIFKKIWYGVLLRKRLISLRTMPNQRIRGQFQRFQTMYC